MVLGKNKFLVICATTLGAAALYSSINCSIKDGTKNQKTEPFGRAFIGIDDGTFYADSIIGQEIYKEMLYKGIFMKGLNKVKSNQEFLLNISVKLPRGIKTIRTYEKSKEGERDINYLTRNFSSQTSAHIGSFSHDPLPAGKYTFCVEAEDIFGNTAKNCRSIESKLSKDPKIELPRAPWKKFSSTY